MPPCPLYDRCRRLRGGAPAAASITGFPKNVLAQRGPVEADERPPKGVGRLIIIKEPETLPHPEAAPPPIPDPCNVAIRCLIISRRRIPNYSMRITAFSGNIVSVRKGQKQKTNNRARIGLRFFPGFYGVGFQLLLLF